VSIQADPHALIAFLLALVRAGTWTLVAPPFTSIRTPIPMKVGVAAALALLAMPTASHMPLPTDTPGFIAAIGVQVAVGALLGLVAMTLFFAVLTGGALSDLFGGIVLPPSLDPLSENQVPKIGELYQLVAVALLFASGGDLVLVHGFVASFAASGLTLGSLGPASQVLTSDLATLFVAALEIAAPVLVVLFAAQVLLGLLAKATPQMNVFLLGFPFQALLLLLTVALAIRVLPADVTNLLERAVLDGARAVGLG
jgi:flagellar biosynthetic protein FliR